MEDEFSRPSKFVHNAMSVRISVIAYMNDSCFSSAGIILLCIEQGEKSMKRKILSALTALLLACTCALPHAGVHAEETASVKLYRLYNPNSGEHFYTSNRTERVNLFNAGWRDESIAWNTPVQGTPVYRLYSPGSGDHHYTVNTNERDMLKAKGWRDEGSIFNSASKDSGIPVYREYNPNARTGAHNYTVNHAEHNQLVAAGWRDEGIAFYADSLNNDIDLLYQSTLDRIVSAARTRIGSSYTLSYPGRLGPNSFDCSGFVDWTYATAGVNRDMYNQACWTGSMNTYLLGQVAHPTTNVTWAVYDPTDYGISFHAGDIILWARTTEDRAAGNFYHAAMITSPYNSETQMIGIIDSLPDIGVTERSGLFLPYSYQCMRVFRIIDI